MVVLAGESDASPRVCEVSTARHMVGERKGGAGIWKGEGHSTRGHRTMKHGCVRTITAGGVWEPHPFWGACRGCLSFPGGLAILTGDDDMCALWVAVRVSVVVAEGEISIALVKIRAYGDVWGRGGGGGGRRGGERGRGEERGRKGGGGERRGEGKEGRGNGEGRGEGKERRGGERGRGEERERRGGEGKGGGERRGEGKEGRGGERGRGEERGRKGGEGKGEGKERRGGEGKGGGERRGEGKEGRGENIE